MRTLANAKELCEFFSYDKEDGILRWKKITTTRVKSGFPAGSLKKDGYIHVQLNGAEYLAHRIIWCMIAGEWPSEEIDHEDLDGSNNKWANLRQASPTQNRWNQGIKKSNTSGYKGVYFQKFSGKWMARIRVGEKQRLYLGIFDSPEEAGAAYNKAALQYHGDFARAA